MMIGERIKSEVKAAGEFEERRAGEVGNDADDEVPTE